MVSLILRFKVFCCCRDRTGHQMCCGYGRQADSSVYTESHPERWVSTAFIYLYIYVMYLFMMAFSTIILILVKVCVLCLFTVFEDLKGSI